MLRLNLLVEEEKQKIRYQRLYLLFLRIEGVFVILLILIAGIVFAGNKILAANVYIASKDTAQLINANSADDTARAKALNDKISVVSQIESGYIAYSRLSRAIIGLIPTSTSLSSLNIDSNAKAINIRGLAPTRDNLLEMETSLKNTPWLLNVNVPLEEKIRKSNIDFDIDMGFDPAKLPK